MYAAFYHLTLDFITGPVGYFQLELVANAAQPNTYEVTAPTRNQCFYYLSCQGCQYNVIDMYSQVSLFIMNAKSRH